MKAPTVWLAVLFAVLIATIVERYGQGGAANVLRIVDGEAPRSGALDSAGLKP